MYFVYMHEHIKTGKKYIGITSQKPEQRWREGRGYAPGYFRSAVDKYGWDAFSHKILFDGLTKEEACRMEQELIAKYKTNNKAYGYNASIGGESGSKGSHHKKSEETKRRLSAALKGKPKSAEHRKHTGEAQIGRKASKSTRAKMSEAHKGAKCHRSRRVAQYTKDGELVKVWDYIKQAAEALGINYRNICACCIGKTTRKMAGGYCWKYWTESEEE